MSGLKIKLIFVFVLAFCFIYAGQALADVGNVDLPAAREEQKDCKIYSGGKELAFHWPAVKEGGGVLVPAPDIAGAVAAEFKYYPGTGKIEFNRGSRSVSFEVSSGSRGGPFRSPEGVVYIPLEPLISGLGGMVYRYGDGERVDVRFSAGGEKTSSPVFPGALTLEQLLPAGAYIIEPDVHNESALRKTMKGGQEEKAEEGSSGSVDAGAGGRTPADDHGLAGAAADFNGDGAEERLICYKRPDGRTGVIIYRDKGSSLQKVWQREEDSPVSDIAITDLNSGGDELIIGVEEGTYYGSVLNIYSWQGDSPGLIYNDIYHRMETGDYNDDGKNELALWSEDVDSTYSVRVLAWDGKGLSVSGDCPGYYKEVVLYYRERLKNRPGSRASMYYLADALLKAGDAGAALEQAARVPAATFGYPPDQYFYLIKGEALLKLGRYREAAEAYKKALTPALYGGMWPGAKYGLARCYKNMGEQKQALLEITGALNYGSDWPEFGKALTTLSEWQNGGSGS